jgi:DNA repair protein RecO (recombination protein O)
MHPGRARVTDALVLRVVDYGESDRIVTLLTREEGRLGGLARGARKSRKRFAGSLQPGVHVRVELRPGRGELFHLDRAEILDAFEGTLTDLRRMALASGVVELLRELCPELEPDPSTFDAGLGALARIAREPPREERLLAFHVHLLGRLGLAPVLEACVATGVKVPEGRPAYFDPARGGVVSRAAGGGPLLLSASAREALLAALPEGDPGVEPWDEEARALARSALDAFTERHLGRRLRASAFVIEVFGR